MRLVGTAPAVLLCLLIVLACRVYVPGLNGDFLFDDYPNLEPLGHLGGVVDWETFRAFVLGGFSGPTGRPLSLASFLLNDYTWPSLAYGFKQTNVLIHLLCGLLLCWAVLLLLRNLKAASERQAQWIALLTCALWLLHPYMVSTTLYVIQRMAQLSTLFCLAGIVLYLYGRLQLADKPKRAYLWMTLAIGAGTLLATFSKENGALLPLLVLVIEFCLPRVGKPAWQWRALCLWLPSAALLVMLARYVDFSANPWPNRNFNMIERLLTEARIVSEYLLHLFVPRIEGKGLYQDGYLISKGLFQPATTALAIAFLLGLLGLALALRKKTPLITLAILFFFAAHLMESTVVGLELYFEHRNYMAALFLFLPLTFYGVVWSSKYRPLPVVMVAILAMLSTMTWMRASLWGDDDRLQLYWVQSAENSPRAVSILAQFYAEKGEYDKAIRYLEEQSARLSHSSFLTAHLLLQKVYLGAATENDFIVTGQKLLTQEFDIQAVKAVRTLAEAVWVVNSRDYALYTLKLLETLNDSPKYNHSRLFIKLQYYLRGLLYNYLAQPELMLEFYSRAIELYEDTDAALAMVTEVANAGYLEEALQLLEQARQVLSKQTDLELKRSRASYESDIEHLEQVLNNAIRQGAGEHEH